MAFMIPDLLKNPPSEPADSPQASDELVPIDALVPLPSSRSPHYSQPASLLPLVHDQRSIPRLLELLLDRSDLSVKEAALRLGVNDNAVRQYVAGRRTNPGVMWLIRFAELCGGRVMIELPSRRQR